MRLLLAYRLRNRRRFAWRFERLLGRARPGGFAGLMFGGRTIIPTAARGPGRRRSRNIRSIRNIRISGGRGTPTFTGLTDAEVGLGTFSAFAAFGTLTPALTSVCGRGIGITG